MQTENIQAIEAYIDSCWDELMVASSKLAEARDALRSAARANTRLRRHLKSLPTKPVETEERADD